MSYVPLLRGAQAFCRARHEETGEGQETQGQEGVGARNALPKEVTALREPLGANMEYKNYEEWKAEGEKVQAELIRVDEQRRQARIDGDDNAYVRLEDEYNRLLIQSRDHMAKMPLRSETPPKKYPPR